MRIRERKFHKTELSGNRLMKNNVTPSGFLSLSYYSLYNHFTPLGLASNSDFSINNHYTTSGLLKSHRDDMIIEQLINKQINPVGVI